MPVLSEELYNELETLNKEYEAKIIETITKRLGHNNVSKPVSFGMRYIVKLEESGRYHIDSIVSYDQYEAILYVNIKNEDGSWHRTVSLVPEHFYDGVIKMKNVR